MIETRPSVAPLSQRVPAHSTEISSPPSPSGDARPRIRGKFIFVGESKFYIRGVTYGTFRPDGQGHEFPDRQVVERDFTLMAANGINAVRTYTAPPRWLLDAAQRHGLKIMAGLPVERSAAFLDYSNCVAAIETMVREKVRECSGHPAILCYSLGNEIPASLVRWHGPRRVEKFLKRLYRAVKKEDPQGLVTYANYPSTEYLELPFLDLVCFNVYLESQTRLDNYLAKLHNLAVDRPLIMGEIGLDSLRKGEAAQARVLDWQIRTCCAGGCAGVFVYSWTDEWFRGGGEVHDWKFGLTDRDRQPKAALTTVREVFSEVPFVPHVPWPLISVIVCSYNGSRTIRDCCQGLERLQYPNYEVIVVDDGSTDQTADIAAGYGFKVIRTSNLGLSNARNTGLLAARGEIVAYIDDDAYPDPHWLTYLVSTFHNRASKNFAGVGGPNIAPPEDGLVAECVAHSPGGPIHVLLTNRKAEHIPGCNMAFRTAALRAIGGFDPQFRVAGDDVDICWRLQQHGWELGFSPSAVVWHHRRNSVRAYWKQQQGYGKAEAMLERKWPEKYNAAGHATWHGRIYGNGHRFICWRAGRIYHGVWGMAPYQPLHEPIPNLLESLPMMPEWYLVIAMLSGLSVMGVVWKPLGFALAPLLIAVAMSVVQAIRCAAHISFTNSLPSVPDQCKRRWITAVLHLLQPMARLYGRLRHGLTLWRRHAVAGYSFPRSWTANIWTAGGQPLEARLQALEGDQRRQGIVARRGGDYDSWDLEINGGVFGSTRLALALEHHGSGRQLLRVHCWPRFSLGSLLLMFIFGGLALGAAWSGALIACSLLGTIALLLVLRTIQECAVGMATFLQAVQKIERREKLPDKTNGHEFQPA
jgi:glycosyltransferase involved in cell wall biosynthesis